MRFPSVLGLLGAHWGETPSPRRPRGDAVLPMRGKERAFEGSGTVWNGARDHCRASQVTDLRALGLSWRGILTSAASDARWQRAAPLLQPLIALVERQLFATETALRSQHSSF